MVIRIALLVVVLAASSEARIQGQCKCASYNKCQQTYKPQQSFKKCLRTCRRMAGDTVPEEYPKCLNQFEHLLSKTMRCAYDAVGTGCTNNESNMISTRNFTRFEEIFLNDFQELADKVGVTYEEVPGPMQEMNRCLLSCFYPAQNICTMRLKCGLFMPNELRLMDNLAKCALHSDISKGIMMEMATCMRSVTPGPDENTEDEVPNEYVE